MKSVNPPLYPPNSLKPVIFYASFPVGSEDYENIVKVWNMGIDARLEALTGEHATYRIETENIGRFKLGRLFVDVFTYRGLQIIIRRLLELENEYAESLADSIIEVEFGVDVI